MENNTADFPARMSRLGLGISAAISNGDIVCAAVLLPAMAIMYVITVHLLRRAIRILGDIIEFSLAIAVVAVFWANKLAVKEHSRLLDLNRIN